MASSSSSSSLVPQIKHDVFISFRGPDTRRGFVSHLYEALCQKKIGVFIDDKLERGDEISTSLLEAIERSQISLVVFSKNYAFSKWCLDELVKIMECLERNGQLVIPIFYEIDPSNVRHLRGSYGDAFAEYGKVFKDNMNKVQNWSSALERAANLSGFHSPRFRTEAMLVKEIIQCVLKRLNYIHKGGKNPKVLVGIHEAVAFLESLLAPELETVRIIGIWGMGGIGKTTIAHELYDRLHFDYEASCFLLNVRENLEKYEVTFLQNELFEMLLDEKDRSIDIPILRYEYIREMLRHTKVLLVLDDVSDLRMMKLFGGRNWFGQGSRVIVTSRDKQLLTNIVDDTYEVKALNFEDSLQLFSLNAFKENNPKLGWIDLSRRAVNYTQGIPLAIEVLGSFFYGKQKEVWKSQLRKLENVPLPGIQNVLRLSYDGLDREEQDIFLYLACFFQEIKDFEYTLFHYTSIMTFLNDCGYSTYVGLTNLQDKALLTLHDYGWDKHCQLHDLIRNMGQEIVREKSRNHPGERCHLWGLDDCSQVLENATGTGAIQSISLNLRDCKGKVLCLSPKAFSGMFNLKFLVFYTSRWVSSRKAEADSFQRPMLAPKGLESIPNSLRILYWKGYPLTCLPSIFCAENLIEVDLSYSLFLERLWDGVQNLAKLKRIKLRKCEQLMELPDFSKAVNLKEIDVSFCIRLRNLHPSLLSLDNHKLEELFLHGCKKLKCLSDLHVRSLRELDAGGCPSLKEFSMVSSKRMGSSSLSHDFFQVLGLSDLRKFTLEFFAPSCGLECLTILDLSGTNIENLPTSIKHLSNLRELYLRNCKRLRFLPPLPQWVQMLDVGNCISLEDVSITTIVPSWTRWSACLLFENCVRLNQQVVSTVMSEAHVIMKLSAYSFYQEEDVLVFVCLPGSKVPTSMYHYKTTTEDSMIIQLSSPANLVGFTVFVIVSGTSFTEEAYLQCFLRRSNGQVAEFISNIDVAWPCLNNQTYQDHVFLLQDHGFSRRIIDKIKESSATDAGCTGSTACDDLELLFEIRYQDGRRPPNIKEWGIWPLYTSDLFTFSEKLLPLLGSKIKRGRDITDESLDIESVPIPPSKKLKTQYNNGQPTTYCLIVNFLKHLWRLVCSLLMLPFLIQKYKDIMSWWSKENEE